MNRNAIIASLVAVAAFGALFLSIPPKEDNSPILDRIAKLEDGAKASLKAQQDADKALSGQLSALTGRVEKLELPKAPITTGSISKPKR